jgi:hypothetical protein
MATAPITSVANGLAKGTKIELQAAVVALIVGLEGLYEPNDVIELPMGDITFAHLVAVFQAHVSAAQETNGSYQAWRDDVQTEREAAVAMRPYRSAMKTVLVSKYGKSSTKLLKYGFQPAKTPVRTTTSKSTAVAKAEATREARGTKGKKQKKAIKGNVTGVVITPVTSGALVPGATPAAGSASANGSNGASAPAAPASPGGASHS